MKAPAAVSLTTRPERGWAGIAASLVRTARWRCSVALAILLTLSLISFGEGAPGDLDPSFGVGGKVTTDFGPRIGRALVLQPDGKLVAAGGAFSEFALARYLPDGSLDTTFGTGGKVITPFGQAFVAANALVLQPDGKLVAAGYSGPSDEAFDFALARYLPDGSLDTSFGTDGKVTTDLGSSDVANALVVQPDGKLVAAGVTGKLAPIDFALVRYLPDGSLDHTFGVNGTVTTDFGSSNDGAEALVLQSDGKLVAAGSSNADFALARYLPNGTLDPTFGTGGKVTTDFFGESTASALVLQVDGKLVAAGFAAEGVAAFALARYLTDGGLDPGFGTGGTVTTDFGGQDMGLALVLQPDGKFVVAGGSNATGVFEFALARYLATGDLDPSFGMGGRVTTGFGELEDIASALVLQTDGKLVAAGSSQASFSSFAFALARYESGLVLGVGPPINKDECHDKGWRTFTVPRVFKNQGDCIQFVNTGK
jgi:uncharacterized delta-60 repeat protein